LLGPAQPDQTAFARHLERTEDSELHRAA
jgi:hypothetical protein